MASCDDDSPGQLDGNSATLHCTLLFISAVFSYLCAFYSMFQPVSISSSLALFLFGNTAHFFRSILLGVCSFARNCIHGMQRHQREAWQLHKPPPHTQHSFLFSFFHFHFFLGSSRSPLYLLCMLMKPLLLAHAFNGSGRVSGLFSSVLFSSVLA